MSNQNLVPRADGSGSLGVSGKRWGAGYFENLDVENLSTGTFDAGTQSGSFEGDFSGSFEGDGSGLENVSLPDNYNTGSFTGSFSGSVETNVPYARASFIDETGISISLTQNTGSQISGSIFSLPISNGITLNSDDELVIQNDGVYRIYSMISFEGLQSGHYELQIRKNGNIICGCNPITQLRSSRLVNLVSVDIDSFSQNDRISVWIENTNSNTDATIYRAKMVANYFSE